MNIVFFISSAVAIIATAVMVTRTNVMHALLYLILSFLAVSLVFYTLGAPFVAALEVIVYAGAIMVLFIFAIMLLNLGPQTSEREREWLKASGWIGPALLALILLGELIYVLVSSGQHALAGTVVDPRQVGIATFSTYLLGVELASILLLASLVGAYHLGQARQDAERRQDQRVIGEEIAETRRFGPPAPVVNADAEVAGKDFVPAPPEEGKGPYGPYGTGPGEMEDQ